ncbi:MAG: T9SS type A sorting domain-containing protein [Candidatus Marinimicrobia bacterium]|jgi:Ca2+-binding RTX toxin-like protein|nr:T9SS type A sorting domain-containing protein [Candidatus Neomarinimicrobiota bacterium]MBT4283243.1 T9SS type A sorting domain-containing protein [Candidatus Neomarinimicrobiota bacterium]MBT4579369.1 T9SS type A sorting domain-containing protein [Candidatus Neomarinimicrobiota bacterium]MBT4956232.1 T9SS type A sorting domain-containing protein [Candidatus Neomarinimicrobiota bacterium]MBT5758988.1 T9SS type A sorting domain-containing protein [Candidatus Neomarinimicrobiota bacterium]
MEAGDPQLFGLVKGFFGETLEYEAEWDMSAGLDFLLHREESLDYTHRSQYLKSARLIGNNSTNQLENNFNNILTGNDGMNTIPGYGGHDVLVGQVGNNDIAKFQGESVEYTIVESDDEDAHDDYFISDLVPNRDSTCQIIDMQYLNFNGIVYDIESLLNVDDVSILPTETQLLPAYPNPFNPATTIQYQLAQDGLVQLTIIDLLGRPVRTLVNKQKPAGKYRIKWDGINDQGQSVSAGIYFSQLHVNSQHASAEKLILLK